MTEPDIENTLYGLSQQEQCDMDGVWVKVPRQAVDEAITLLRKLERYQEVAGCPCDSKRYMKVCLDCGTEYLPLNELPPEIDQ